MVKLGERLLVHYFRLPAVAVEYAGLPAQSFQNSVLTSCVLFLRSLPLTGIRQLVGQ